MIVKHLVLSDQDLDVGVVGFSSGSGRETQWLHFESAKENGSFNIFATKQQLLAIYEALSKWKDESSRLDHSNISPQPSSGNSMMTLP